MSVFMLNKLVGMCLNNLIGTSSCYTYTQLWRQSLVVSPLLPLQLGIGNLWPRVWIRTMYLLGLNPYVLACRYVGRVGGVVV